MRVTNKMLSNNFLSDMNTNLQNLQTIQKQMSTGKLFSKPSDDPFSVARAMQLHTNINTNTMYNANIKDTINWLDTTDTALKQTGDVFQRVRELLVGSGNGTYSPSEKQKIKDEINQRVSQLSQILNTNFDGKYIFGGTRGTVKPTDVLNPFKSTIGVITQSATVGASKAEVSGVFTGTETTNYTFDTDFTSNPPTLTLARKISTDGGDTWSIATHDSPYTLTKDADGKGYYTTVDDMKIYLNGKTSGNGYTFTVNVANHIGNTKLVYANKDGSSLNPAGTQDEKNQFAMIGTGLQTEVSQGVTMKYNVGANEVLQYGTGTDDNVMQLLQRITNHLDGKNADGTDPTATDPNPTTQLSGQDLKDLDSAISNLLTLRSQVGAKQNRMESAQTQNTDMNASLTEIMAKTEDIDITQKTMEYATAQTVYLASLQTSAKVILPTLMDYLR